MTESTTEQYAVARRYPLKETVVSYCFISSKSEVDSYFKDIDSFFLSGFQWARIYYRKTGQFNIYLALGGIALT